MSITNVDFVGAETAIGRGGGGPAPTRIVVAYGFWIFLLSDIIIFSALFATYAVRAGSTAGGPTGRELFSFKTAFIETMILLVSSYTCGLAALSMEQARPDRFYLFFALTFLLGALFLGIEITEFAGMVREGAPPQKSAFLSSFFTLVGTHGAHVIAGLVWLVYMTALSFRNGFLPEAVRRSL